MNFFFLSTGFQWPTPELFDKIGAADPWVSQKVRSGTERTSAPTKTTKADVDRYIRGHWLYTARKIGFTQIYSV